MRFVNALLYPLVYRPPMCNACQSNDCIMYFIQEDEKFLSEVFAQLTDEATDDDKRRELVR